MPLFEYRCLDCDNIDEHLKKSSDAQELTACTKCGGDSKRRLSAPGGFVFKGNAFSASSAKKNG